jgi:hypothetical protein
MTPSGRPLPTGPDLEAYLEATEVAMYENMYRALPAEVATSLGVAAPRLGHALGLTAKGFDHRLFNRVLAISDPMDALEKAAPHYAAAGISRWMLQVLPHIETEAFRTAATERGLVRLRRWARHVGPSSLRIPARSDLVVRRIAGEARGVLADTPRGETLSRAGQAWARIVIDAFQLHAGLEPWFRALAGRPGWHLYLAYLVERPVAAAALFLPPGNGVRVAHLAFAGTVVAHRGRGAQSALVAQRFEDAHALGARWVTTETGENLPGRPNVSHRNMVRLGLPVRYVRANWGPPKSGPAL